MLDRIPAKFNEMVEEATLHAVEPKMQRTNRDDPHSPVYSYQQRAAMPEYPNRYQGYG
jgi:hypothetical protein